MVVRESQSSSEHEVEFQPIGRRVLVASGSTLAEATRRAGILLSSTCGGEGTCGRCRVRVVDGLLQEPSAAERETFSSAELSGGCRLACQTPVRGDMKVHVPRTSLASGQRLQVAGSSARLRIDALVRSDRVEVAQPSLEDPRADLDRVVDALGSARGGANLWASTAAIRALPGLLRSTGWQVEAYTRGLEIVGFAAPGNAPVGLAVDLGTTKVAGYLVDLKTGRELAALGVANPQIAYGEDLVSRMAHAMRRPDGARELARVIQAALDELAGALADVAGVGRTQIAEVCVVGNTAMTHLLLELPVRQLAASPFVPAAEAALDVPARELGLAVAPGAHVHILPCIAGFVGADHVAMILASNMDRSSRRSLGLDIGTNTEVVLSRPGQATLSASCASGPAFEGAHIHQGMRAAAGAIERVHIRDGTVEVGTVDDAAAVGLCGSGIVDAVAELRRVGVLNVRGRFQASNGRVQQGRDGPEYQLVPGARSGTGEDVVVTCKDVDEVLLAKGAIQAGFQVLLDVCGLRAEDLDEVVVAGAFGSHLNLGSAVAVGLLPRLPLDRFRVVGNAAGTGAKQALVSRQARRRAERIAREANYVELTTHPGFARLFARAMMLPDPV